MQCHHPTILIRQSLEVFSLISTLQSSVYILGTNLRTFKVHLLKSNFENSYNYKISPNGPHIVGEVMMYRQMPLPTKNLGFFHHPYPTLMVITALRCS